MKNHFQKIISDSISVKQLILNDDQFLTDLQSIVKVIVDAFRADRKMLLCGNGGSAADAQHIAAELSGRFNKERRALYAEALHVNSSFLTAVANDYSFEVAYARMIEAAGRPGDILIAISTSGNSPNILKAIEAARQQKMIIVGLTGKTGGKMALNSDFILRVPSTVTARIQESHILIGHLICEMVEVQLFS